MAIWVPAPIATPIDGVVWLRFRVVGSGIWCEVQDCAWYIGMSLLIDDNREFKAQHQTSNPLPTNLDQPAPELASH